MCAGPGLERQYCHTTVGTHPGLTLRTKGLDDRFLLYDSYCLFILVLCLKHQTSMLHNVVELQQLQEVLLLKEVKLLRNFYYYRKLYNYTKTRIRRSICGYTKLRNNCHRWIGVLFKVLVKSSCQSLVYQSTTLSLTVVEPVCLCQVPHFSKRQQELKLKEVKEVIVTLKLRNLRNLRNLCLFRKLFNLILRKLNNQ